MLVGVVDIKRVLHVRIVNLSCLVFDNFSLVWLYVIFRFVQRFDEPDFLDFVLTSLLTFCLDALLSYKLLSINFFWLHVLVFPSKGHLHLRMLVIAQANQEGAFRIRNET